MDACGHEIRTSIRGQQDLGMSDPGASGSVTERKGERFGTRTAHENSVSLEDGLERRACRAQAERNRSSYRRQNRPQIGASRAVADTGSVTSCTTFMFIRPASIILAIQRDALP